MASSIFGMAGMVIDPTSLGARKAAQQTRNRRPDLLEYEQGCKHLGSKVAPPQPLPQGHPPPYDDDYTDDDTATTDSGTDSDGDYDTDSSGGETDTYSDTESETDHDADPDSDPEFISKEAYDNKVWELYKDGPQGLTPDIAVGSKMPFSLDGDTLHFDTWQQSPLEDGRVFTGYWTDPNTGVKFKTYQDALPAPNVAEKSIFEDDLKHTHPKLIALSGWIDPNRKEPAKKEQEAGLPGIADGASFAGNQLLSTGDRNEYRYRVARDIFMHRHHEQPGDRMPEMDRYPNGYVGFQAAFRPAPWMGVTFRGEESRWVGLPSPQTPSGKQLQTVQSKVLLNQNPTRQQPARIAPIELPTQWHSRGSLNEDRNPENRNRGGEQERYHQITGPGSSRRMRRGDPHIQPKTQRGVHAEQSRTGPVQIPGSSRRAKNYADVPMTQRGATRSAAYLNFGTHDAGPVHTRARHLKSTRPGTREGIAKPVRIGPVDLARHVQNRSHVARQGRGGGQRESTSDYRGLNLRIDTKGRFSHEPARNKPDIPMTQKESLARPQRTGPTQGDRLVTLRYAPNKPDVRMTQRESTGRDPGKIRNLDASWRQGFDRVDKGSKDRMARRNDADTSKYARLAHGVIPSQGAVHPHKDRCWLQRNQPEQITTRDTYKPHIGGHVRPGEFDRNYRRKNSARGTRVPTHLGHQSGIYRATELDTVASDIDTDTDW